MLHFHSSQTGIGRSISKRACAAFFATMFLSQIGICQDPKTSLETLRNLKANDDVSQRQAVQAINGLRNAKSFTLIDTLKAMRGASPLGKNWLSGLANVQFRAAGSKVTADLEGIFSDTNQDPEARYMIYRWMTDGDDAKRKSLLTKLVNDPSPELRYDAIAEAMSNTPDDDKPRLQELLSSARHPEQVVAIIAKLNKLGADINQSSHFGFVKDWTLIGPFDHVGTKNFETVFEVEKDWLTGKVKKAYTGKSGEVAWTSHATEDAEGVVDLAKVFNNEKGCIVYGTTSIFVPEAIDCEVRLGCINGHKVWINQEPIISNEIYHAAMQIDQFTAPVHLKAGENRILVKVAQNEQKEPWAQRFVFQIRFCDSTGKAINFSLK